MIISGRKWGNNCAMLGCSYYQPSMCFTSGWLVPRLHDIFCICLFVCWLVCTSALITYTIITSIMYIVAMQLYLGWLTAALSTGVDTVSTVNSLKYQGTDQRQRRSEADQEWKHQKWAITCEAYTERLTYIRLVVPLAYIWYHPWVGSIDLLLIVTVCKYILWWSLNTEHWEWSGNEVKFLLLNLEPWYCKGYCQTAG